MTEDWGTATWRYHQAALNAARPRDEFEAMPPFRVRARIVWAEDGADGCEGMATRRGADGAIFVEIKDRRSQAIGQWLHPDDVWWPGKR